MLAVNACDLCYCLTDPSSSSVPFADSKRVSRWRSKLTLADVMRVGLAMSGQASKNEFRAVRCSGMFHDFGRTVVGMSSLPYTAKRTGTVVDCYGAGCFA